jgi:sugar porter (SP) family MFS transporter
MVLISLIVALGGFLMGFDASVISGVVKFIEPEFELSKLEIGWAVSSVTLTATIAMLLVGPLSDRIGRKRVLSYSAAIYAFSAILSALAPNFISLVIARMLGGFGVGASLIIAPMYIAETAPANVRGRLVSLNQLNIVIGISTAFFTNYLILKWGQLDASWAKSLQFDLYSWRWMLGIEAVPALIYFIALFIVPRSPRWLLMHGFQDEAKKVLLMSVGEEAAQNDLEEVKKSLQEDAEKPKKKWMDLFHPTLKVVLLIGVVVAILQQITGINSVFFYAPMIFEQSGLGTDAAFTQAIYVGLANLIFTIVAITMIDRIGRKPLLMFGLIGIAISMFVLSWGFKNATYQFDASNPASQTVLNLNSEIISLENTTFETEESYIEAVGKFISTEQLENVQDQLIESSMHLNSSLILIAILFFVASFAVSIGPVMWVLFSELFPNAIRAIAISFVGFINSVISFGVQLVFPWELEYLGSSTTFLIYGVFAAIGLLFVLVKVPETKGKSLEELEKYLIKQS